VKARTLLGDKPVDLQVACEGAPRIYAPPRVLHVVLGNLLRNACSYTDRGLVEVTVHEGLVQVRDTGIGMSAEALARAFEPFYRARPEYPVGTGLGLSIVRRLCERFGWSIELESTLDSGTTARIRFSPIGQDPDDGVLRPQGEAAQPQGCTFFAGGGQPPSRPCVNQDRFPIPAHMSRTPRPNSRRPRWLPLAGGVVVLALLGGAAWYWGGAGSRDAEGAWRAAPVERGTIRVAISSTGTLSATSTVTVGSQISGQVLEVLVDYNDRVTEGQVLARIDPKSYEAQIAQGNAQIASAQASLRQAQAALANAEAD